jgi:SAM-dependent methyltransferase
LDEFSKYLVLLLQLRIRANRLLAKNYPSGWSSAYFYHAVAADMNKTLNQHEYPDYFKRNPKLIKLLYATCYLSQFRKWYLQPLIRNLIRSQPADFVYVDFGCGEGQFLFPFAERYQKATFVAVDKNQNNFDFYRLYIEKMPTKNVLAVHASVEQFVAPVPADVAVCIGVLHFVDDDLVALRAMRVALKAGGKLLLQVPVNDKVVLPWYRSLASRLGNYDTIQSRQRHYTPKSLHSIVQLAGFTVESSTLIYGYCGKLAHELFNIPFLYYLNGTIIQKVIAFLAFNLLLPFIMLLYIIDYCISHKAEGNGIILIAKAV